MSGQKIVKIFTMEQQFPCGPQSSCCGPIGQSEQEVMSLRSAIEELGVDVEIYDAGKLKNLQGNPQVFKLLRSFGPQAIPIIAVGDDIVCMGQSDTNDIIQAIKSKL